MTQLRVLFWILLKGAKPPLCDNTGAYFIMHISNIKYLILKDPAVLNSLYTISYFILTHVLGRFFSFYSGLYINYLGGSIINIGANFFCTQEDVSYLTLQWITKSLVWCKKYKNPRYGKDYWKHLLIFQHANYIEFKSVWFQRITKEDFL